MCLYPTVIENKKYKMTKKNGGKVPIMKDIRVKYVPVACQKCMECRTAKAREWRVRLTEEIRTHNKAYFVTWTFSDEALEDIYTANERAHHLTGYDLDNELATYAVRHYLENWRSKHKKSVKHWIITELGQKATERIHLHGLIFTDIDKQEIIDRWTYGHVFIGDYVNEKTINYITKYVSKADQLHKEYKPKIFASPGLGANYIKREKRLNKFNGKKTIEYYRTSSGHKLSLPIYYRNLLYTEEQKEELWLYKLDKEVRYINGIKIDVSQNEDVYYSRLETERKQNTWLGYETNSINWERRYYERQRRNLNKRKKMATQSDRISNPHGLH